MFRTNSLPERSSPRVVRKHKQMAFLDTKISQARQAIAHEPCTNSLTTKRRRDGKMMDEPTTTIVSDEDRTHHLVPLHGNETESRISLQERLDRVLRISLAHANAISGLPQIPRRNVVLAIEDMYFGSHGQ